MGGRSSRPADSLKVPERAAEKKKGLGDWMNLLKPSNEEKDHWVPDEAVSKCTACGTDFSAFLRKVYLQDEMEKNRRAASGSESDGSGKHMKEVACPTCIVHLQVQVPSSGLETIECGVCQHPFLVSAH
ncbi:hypothetical protein Ancab_016775 [Ancistrocladus abbreviatus]